MSRNHGSGGKHLAIYLPFLAGGGAERLYLDLAPHFVSAGMRVSFLLDRDEGELRGRVPDGIGVTVLGAPRLRHAVPLLARRFRTAPPDLFLSCISLNSAGALLAKTLGGGPARLLLTQHNTLSREASRGGVYRALPLLTRLLIHRADAVAAVSSGVAADLARVTRLPLDRIEIIPNGVITADFDARAAAPCPHPWLGEGAVGERSVPVLLGVGRLNVQKDFGTLIRAAAALGSERPVRLVILGEGSMRAELAALAQSLGIGEWVDMPGYVANPLPYMRAADALVMSSRYEGFGLVLAEALACGTPVVSTDCEHGPAEILGNGAYGTLVPVGDPEAMARAIAGVLDAPPARALLQARGREYTVEECARRYLALFERMLARPAVR